MGKHTIRAGSVKVNIMNRLGSGSGSVSQWGLAIFGVRVCGCLSFIQDVVQVFRSSRRVFRRCTLRGVLPFVDSVSVR